MTGRARGKLISIEGGEGAGKTTLTRGLADSPVCSLLCVREPGSTAMGEALRDLMLRPASPPLSADNELLLMFSARQRLLQEQIEPTLQSGRHVLCDRYLDSSYAYQVHAGGASEPLMQACIRELKIPLPDLTLLLDIAPAEGLERHSRKHGEKDSFEARSADFLQRVRQGFLIRARQEPGRIAVLNASLPAEKLLLQAGELIAKLLRS